MVWSSAESLEDGAPAFRGWTGLGISLQRRQEDDEAAAKNIDCSVPRGGVSEQPGVASVSVKTGLEVHEGFDCQVPHIYWDHPR